MSLLSLRAAFTALLICSALTCCSYAHATDDAWQAEWIASSEPTQANSWWCFRKQVAIDDPAAITSARIACDSKYWLWINGELVVFEGQLKRGPTPSDTYYDEVDLSGKLQPGNNTLAVLVWHFGKQGMSHKNSGKAGLVFDASSGDQQILSDDSWRVRRHPAYVATRGTQPNWRLPESNIGYDARKALGAWQSAGFDDTDWPQAIEQGQPPTAPWNRLVRRPIPAWKVGDLQDYENAADLPTVSSGEPIIARLPYNAQVTPYLEVEATAGELIDVRTDNYVGGSEPNVRAEYTTRDGKQSYESLGWMNGHEVIYSIPASVKIIALKYRESSYDADLTGSFECSDERLNTLWRKAQRTLLVNMRDTYYDCPGRERAQWWGDVTLEIQQAFYGLDRRADRLSRKAILELANWQKPGGELFSPIPAGSWNQELPTQMLASVGRFGFWEYYRHTGDVDTIRQVYPAVNRYLSLWTQRPDGLVEPRQGGWTWGDWGTNKDMPLLFNAWYYLALDGRQRMAELLGDVEQAEADAAAQERLATAFNRDFWTNKGYRSPSHSGPIDDRGNALAVVSGIAESTKHQVLKEVLINQRHASPYMEKYVLEALFQLGETN
ncbi:MAG: glycoside hydrolase, partial [Planctomycetota bacterium]